jgi:hypothetical protein
MYIFITQSLTFYQFRNYSFTIRKELNSALRVDTIHLDTGTECNNHNAHNNKAPRRIVTYWLLITIVARACVCVCVCERVGTMTTSRKQQKNSLNQGNITTQEYMEAYTRVLQQCGISKKVWRYKYTDRHTKDHTFHILYCIFKFEFFYFCILILI